MRMTDEEFARMYTYLIECQQMKPAAAQKVLERILDEVRATNRIRDGTERVGTECV